MENINKKIITNFNNFIISFLIPSLILTRKYFYVKKVKSQEASFLLAS